MNKENMTFEEATKVLLDELKNNLAALHKQYEVRPTEWSKMHDQLLKVVSEETQIPYVPEVVVEVRPRELECDVVRYQNNKEKWVALVGLLNGHPYEIFTGLQDEDEGIMLPSRLLRVKS